MDRQQMLDELDEIMQHYQPQGDPTRGLAATAIDTEAIMVRVAADVFILADIMRQTLAALPE